MIIAIATATFFNVPFQETLDLIKNAGFEYVELDIYWKGGDNWEAGQHLKNIRPREVLKMVRESGLKISSLHDIGGVIYDDKDSLVAHDTYEYLEFGADDIPCIVFHTPHKKTNDKNWWENYKTKAGTDLQELKGKSMICIENMPCFEGYQVPLADPREFLGFAEENNIFVNIDTTHYAQMGVDLMHAASTLKELTKCIHLSDYKDGKSHLFVGAGELDFRSFFNNLYMNHLYSITLECAIPYEAGNPVISIQAMKQAKDYLENIIREDKG